MKFLHAADLHLDSPLIGLSAYPDAPAQRLRSATREALQQLVTAALEEAVDFLVIAGDLYDGHWRDFNTGLFFVRQMGRLRQAGIAVYLLYGNHDAESEMTRSLQLPDNVHVFSARKAQTFRLEAHQVALHGQSFQTACTTDNLVPGYPAPIPGWFNIGVLHTALQGHAEHAPYAPCTPAELHAKGYQYWALGHVHQAWIERGPQSTIAYPGNLQGRHIRELGAHGALLVTVHEEGDIHHITPLHVDVLRWHLLTVDISAAVDARSALHLVGQALEQVLHATPADRALAVRVHLCGTSAAHAALALSPVQLRQEVLAQAVALDAERLWIEKVQLASQALPLHTGDEADATDALVRLQTLARSAVQDADFVAAVQADWQALLAKLPHDVLQAAPDLAALRQDSAREVPARTEQALTLLMARLSADP